MLDGPPVASPWELKHCTYKGCGPCDNLTAPTTWGAIRALNSEMLSANAHIKTGEPNPNPNPNANPNQDPNPNPNANPNPNPDPNPNQATPSAPAGRAGRSARRPSSIGRRVPTLLTLDPYL